MNRGGSHSRPIGLDAVYNKRDTTVRARSVIVEKPGHRGDVVLVKNRNAIERVAVDRICVLVVFQKLTFTPELAQVRA